VCRSKSRYGTSDSEVFRGIATALVFVGFVATVIPDPRDTHKLIHVSLFSLKEPNASEPLVLQKKWEIRP
jgi:hypothetical protein